MYFDAKAITQILSDEKTAQGVAAAIAAERRRFTSPLAVVEAILALAPGRDGAEVEAQVMEFLATTGIEMRDMPPTPKMIAAAAAAAAGGSASDVLNQTCADYYEAAVFSIADALAQPPQPDSEKE